MPSVPPPQRVVVVGAGLAGASAVRELRAAGYAGPLTLLGAEPHRPYDRPPLSKALLAGEVDDTTLGPDVTGALDGVDVRLATPAGGLVEDGVVLEDGSVVAADAVVLATGASPVRLPGAGAHELRTVDDARRLRRVLRPGAHLVVVGAGWIGAEVATTAARAGCAVTVLEAASEPLGHAVGDEVGRHTRAWYAEAGVDLRTGVHVAAVEPDGAVLDDGSRVAADAVLVAVGVRPATGWLQDSGLVLDRGVVVDEHLAAAPHAARLPRVVAVGDCAAWTSRRFGRRLRVEHWDSALHAPAVAVATLLGGHAVYDPVPYMWSEQLGRRVQHVGVGDVAAGDRLVLRGDPGGDPAWSVAWVRPRPDGGDQLQALLAVDRPRDTAQARRLVASAAPVDVERLADVDVPVKAATAR